MVTSSRSGLLASNYNLHKSNSTYFTDFEAGRLELLISMVGHGIDNLRKELAKEGRESLTVNLGGVSCNFKREIKT